MRSAILWFLAFLITVSLAVFQRMTGPTYPLRTSIDVGGVEIPLKLLRTHAGEGGLPVAVPLEPLGEDAAAQVEGVVRWRLYPTDEPWSDLPMVREDGALRAELPHLPSAGKLEYEVILWPEGDAGDGQTVTMAPEGEAVVARYRAEVSATVLIPHILAMFGSMLLSSRALLEVLRSGRQDARWMIIGSMALLMLGGLLLGPMVQKQAFDAYWTGWPFGHDLTDNKTLLAVLAWLPATLTAMRRRPTRWWAVSGWIVMTGVFLVPHSMRGSELDWSQQAPPVTGGAVAGSTGTRYP